MPPTADVIIEAWAPTREACIAEAVGGLVETFVDISETCETAVPIATSIGKTADGVVEGTFTLARATDGEPTGSVPKGISLSGLVFVNEGGRWRCQFTVDV